MAGTWQTAGRFCGAPAGSALRAVLSRLARTQGTAPWSDRAFHAGRAGPAPGSPRGLDWILPEDSASGQERHPPARHGTGRQKAVMSGKAWQRACLTSPSWRSPCRRAPPPCRGVAERRCGRPAREDKAPPSRPKMVQRPAGKTPHGHPAPASASLGQGTGGALPASGADLPRPAQTLLRQAPDFLQSALRSSCMSLLRRQYGARLLNMVRSLSLAFSQAKRGNDEEHLQDAPMHHGKTIDMELLLWKRLYLFSLHWEFLEQQALSLPHYSGFL